MLNTYKKITAIVAGMCAVSSPALAQSGVTVYGVADLGVSIDSNGNKGDKVSRVGSGYVYGSRLGFSGSEDLGNGLRALFVLEMGVDMDIGAMKSYPDPSSATPAAPGGGASTGFNRRAHVGLSGDFGTVLLGRDYTPLFWTAATLDPMEMGMYGNLQAAGVLSGTGIERFGRASNSVFYTTPTFGGFKGRFMYSAGSESNGAQGRAPKNANDMLAIGGEYKSGPILVSGAHQQLKMPMVANGAFTGNGTRKDTIFGARYSTNVFSLSAGYLKITQPVPHSDGRDIWLGASYTMGASKLYAMVQKLRQASAKADRNGTSYGLGYKYSMSKRTSVYTTIGYVKNDTNAAFALLASDPIVAPGALGASPRGLALGILHSF
ncbi:porin [Janthinobacterium sp. HLX7-2]|uniref:porin n=1 Tax=Janthinobacterium sp. HLX7-2 TaxID=1259331 RepID=UPI003F22D492